MGGGYSAGIYGCHQLLHVIVATLKVPCLSNIITLIRLINDFYAVIAGKEIVDLGN